MSIRHGSPRPRRYAGGVIQQLEVVNVGYHSYGLVDINKSVCLLMMCTTLHARCAIVIPNATKRVQNYAGSGIKCSSC